MKAEELLRILREAPSPDDRYAKDLAEIRAWFREHDNTLTWVDPWDR